MLIDSDSTQFKGRVAACSLTHISCKSRGEIAVWLLGSCVLCSVSETVFTRGVIHRFFVSDEGAVTDPHDPESFRSGTDVYLGAGPSEEDFTKWSKDGEIPKGRVDDAARRTLLPRFLLGEFDDPSTVPFWDHAGGCGVVGAERHRQLAYEAAAQSFVLLKNEGSLPLAKGKKIALVGPFTNATWYAPQRDLSSQ